MAEVVNLRMARKRRDRAEKERLASENRARHGQGKAERQVQAADEDRRTATLDAHRRDGSDPDGAS